jgi:hypothetical protein
MTSWPTAEDDGSIHGAILPIAGTILLSGVLLFLSGVTNQLEDTLADIRREEVELSQFNLAEARLKNSGLFYGLVGGVILTVAASVVLSGGLVQSPLATVLIGAFLLGQILAPETSTVWWLFGLGALVVAVTHGAFVLLDDRWWSEGFDNLKFDGRLYIAPSLLTALASTFVNSASVRYRNASSDRAGRAG